MSTRAWILGLGFLGVAGLSRADTVVFPSGGTIQGVILKEVEGTLYIHLRHGFVSVPKAEIASVTKDDEAVLRGKGRLAPWQACLRVLIARPWGPDLRPEPALIIDSGPFKNVPYVTDRSGAREFSIFGDPDEPAGLEIGLSKELSGNPDARKEAVLALRALLADPKDQEALGQMDLSKKGKSENVGLVFETNEDTNAKGDSTWWISIYNPQALDRIRLSEEDTKKLGGGSSGSSPGQTSAGGGSPPSSPGTPSTTNGTPGTFGFSPGALNGGSTSPPPNTSRRTYRGGNFGNYWRTMHPKPPTPKNPPK